MKMILLVIMSFVFLTNCTSKPNVAPTTAATDASSNRAVSSEDEEDEDAAIDAADEATMDDIAASRGTTDDAAYAVSMCEQDPKSCIVKAGSGTKIKGQLVKKGGKFKFEVYKNGAFAYDCLASPGKSHRTPLMTVKPYALEKRHVVSGRKSYRGAIMPNVVWLRGDYAVHGSNKVTGNRESHGCVRIACDLQFYNDVRKAGLGNTTVSITVN